MNSNQLPTFSDIKPASIEPSISKILENNLAEVESLLKSNKNYTWDNLMQPLEQLGDKLHQAWSPVSHMNSVVNSDDLRQAYNACLPKLSDYGTAISQNQQLYQAIKSLTENSEYQKYDFAQKKILEHELRDFKLSGVALSDDKKKRFAQLSKELSQLTTKFEENVLDATMGWHLHLTDEQQISGIPEHAVIAAKQLAESQNKDGWLFSLEIPSYLATVTYADDRNVREQMYTAYVTRASDKGPNAGKWDNSQVMQDILQHRLELAKLLDFNNFAEYSLATKMVQDTQDVLAFLNDLVKAAKPQAQREFNELSEFAKQFDGTQQLHAWDIAYYSEKLRQDRYAISQEDLRPYFPEHKVVSGLFAIVNKLFGIQIEAVDQTDVWHQDARCYKITDADGNLISYIYFDLYARQNKRGGAWMDDCRGRRLVSKDTIQHPIAFLTCNFNAPINNKPALFTHDEVVTLFHEFGHSLQHMLTKIDYADVAGINGIPWDAVEIASQFLENWAYEKESIALISEHYESGDALPDELFNKLHKAKNFQSAMQMVRQLEFALFDFRLHMEFDPSAENQVQQTLDEVRAEVSVVPIAEFNRFQHGFSHIFAGGYAAGYYSYKWAEVMAADAFSLFKENGIFDRNTSDKFLKTFLQCGGAIEPMDLFIEFRGRKPEVKALLEQSGIHS